MARTSWVMVYETEARNGELFFRRDASLGSDVISVGGTTPIDLALFNEARVARGQDGALWLRLQLQNTKTGERLQVRDYVVAVLIRQALVDRT